jgi:hypothetical protein
VTSLFRQKAPTVLGRFVLLGALSAGIQAGLPASALAVTGPTCQAPPGLSGLDQYCESVPAPGGGSGGSRTHKPKSTQIPKQTAQALEKQGAAGQAVLALTGSSATPPTTPQQTPSSSSQPATKPAAPVKRHHSRHHAQPVQTSTPAPKPATAVPERAASDNPLSAIGSSASSGSPGEGALIGLLVLIAGIVGCMTWLKYRRRLRDA